MNLKQLEAFVRIADTGSFSMVAKELYLTQPTVSAHISALEKELNSRLFVRNTREVYLSESGEMLYDYAKQMIALQKQIELAFSLQEDREERCLTIATSTIPAQYLLPKILTVFNEKYPAQQFKIVETDSAKVVEQVTNHIADIGFTGTVINKKLCKYIPFYQDELVVITPNNLKYRELKKTQKDATWITTENLIMREKGSGTRKEAETQLRKTGVNVSGLNVIASMESPEMIKKSVENGMGISIISKLATEEEVANGTLIAFPISEKTAKRDVNVIYDRNMQPSKMMERLIKIVKELYKKKEKNYDLFR